MSKYIKLKSYNKKACDYINESQAFLEKNCINKVWMIIFLETRSVFE